ncbi:GntR family transcriptional regulator [Nocardioides anomalus]|uniref:GntR family transcriptional regulator n=1 Tax=Nocardioides anomalus TaxID=2712223 RepID=A0A6G6WF10_9ACTN|nr:GntR family transcriptional regulator [Nocardioides anomalus]QIG43743.1 GntR family transcriptional regulator [Nocardioides anomalus]
MTGLRLVAADDDRTPAYVALRQAIVEGRYRPGERLQEQRIATELQLSRTPVREALRSLEAEGLVVIALNRGAVVRPIDVGEVEDLYDLRARLESYAAHRAVGRAGPADLERMDEAIADFDEHADRAAGGDPDALRTVNDANARFHQAVLEAARHERLGVLLRRATDVPLVFQAFRHFDRAAMERSNLFHRLIRAAVAGADAGRAEALMAEHIDQGRDVLLERLAHSGSVDALFDTDPHHDRSTQCHD